MEPAPDRANDALSFFFSTHWPLYTPLFAACICGLVSWGAAGLRFYICREKLETLAGPREHFR